MNSLNKLLQDMSPEVKNFVRQKLDNLADDDLLSLANAFKPFPSAKRKADHPDDDDWFVLPEFLGNLPHSKTPVGEGLRMLDWQKIVFAETSNRGLGHPQFWSRSQIDYERKDLLELALRGESLKNTRNVYYDPREDVLSDPMDNFVNDCVNDCVDDCVDNFVDEQENQPKEILMSTEELDEFEGESDD